MTEQKLILVTGGTGKTGRRVVERLQARGLPVRVGSRAGEPPFDWTAPETWAAALNGVWAVYITYQPDVAVPGADAVIRAFAAQAVASGVRRLVLLTGRGEPQAQACEQIVRDAANGAGAGWTVVRASWFNQNFSEGFMLDAILSGEVVLPVGDAPEPFIDADDIADIVTAALTSDQHVGQTYEVTGPRLLTFAQAVSEIAAAAGRDVSFVPVPPDAYVSAMRAEGAPEAMVWLVNFLFTEVMDGRNSSLADGVRRALGRPARDFADYARATADSGVWRVTSPAG